MGLFNFFKKKTEKQVQKEPSAHENLEDIANTLLENNMISVPKDDNHNTFGESLDKLVDGDLPWGWVAHKQNFTEPIAKKYKCLLNLWVDARNGSPQELYSALKDFVLYMEDIEKLCKSKGECYEFWFTEILTGKGYLKKRQQELKLLSKNILVQQNEYKQKQKTLSNLDSSLLNLLQNNDGVLQKDIYKNFDSCVKPEIQHLLYDWEKSGKIQRTKVGNTYKITL